MRVRVVSGIGKAGQVVGRLASKVGLWRKDVFSTTEKIFTPHEKLQVALKQSKIYEELEKIYANNPNAAEALRNKLSKLMKAETLADKI